MINIQITDQQWEWLNKNKKAGESFQNVLERIIKLIKYDKLQKDLENIK